MLQRFQEVKETSFERGSEFIFETVDSLYHYFQKININRSGSVVKLLDSQSRVLCSKPLGCSEVDSALHPSEVDKMSTRDFWELSGKK